LLKPDGNVLDYVACRVNTERFHGLGGAVWVCKREGGQWIIPELVAEDDTQWVYPELATDDSAQWLIRYDWEMHPDESHDLTVAGRVHHFSWDETKAENFPLAQWQRNGLCRLAIRNDRFDVLWPPLDGRIPQKDSPKQERRSRLPYSPHPAVSGPP
jgi:hypothetical protein